MTVLALLGIYLKTAIGCAVPQGHKRYEAHLSSVYAIDAPPVVGTSYIFLICFDSLKTATVIHKYFFAIKKQPGVIATDEQF